MTSTACIPGRAGFEVLYSMPRRFGELCARNSPRLIQRPSDRHILMHDRNCVYSSKGEFRRTFSARAIKRSEATEGCVTVGGGSYDARDDPTTGLAS